MTRKRIFRWLLWIAGTVLALVLITAAVVTSMLRASLPKLDGELRAAGVRSSVVIERDELGVPTITVPLANHDNNQHAENENLRLQNLWDGIELYAGLLAGIGREWRTTVVP